jgi:hypothetical protein
MVADVLGQMGIQKADTVQEVASNQFDLFEDNTDKEIEIKEEDYTFTL